MSRVPVGQYLRIYVDTSASPTFPATPYFYYTLCEAGPYHGPYKKFDTVNGYVHNYIVNGVDSNPSGYHGYLKMNFDKAYAPHTPPDSLVYNNEMRDPNCDEFDLGTVLLHNLTHIFGWFSWTDTLHTGLKDTLYSNYDTSLHKAPAPWLSSNPFGSLTPVYPYSGPAPATVWANGKLPPENYPVAYPWNHWNSSYYYNRMSPGEMAFYIMSYAFNRGNKRRVYLKGEIEHLHTIGYDYDSTFAADSAAQINNHVPYSKKMGSDTSNRLFISYLDEFCPEELLPPDYTITNDSGISVTINLLGNPDFEDADGDTIRIADGSLVNYRGCGIGGNNHKCLSVSNRNQTITFTPRHNFYGRAQFGFNLRDSLQEGGFVLYTIEVKKGNNVSTPGDSNLALNGDFEEGTEVKTTDSSNYLIRNSLWLKGQMNHLYSDCHPFDFSFAWAGTAIRNSLKTCTLPLGTAAYWGGENTTFPFTFDFTPPWIATYLAPEAVASVGNRYQPISDTLNVYLTDTMRRCNQYTLEFDAVHLQKWISPTIPYPKYDEVGVGFWSDTMFYAGMPRRSYRPAFVYRTNKIVYGSWTHFSVPFSYCSDTTANILSISLKGLMGTVPGFQAIDNITLKRSTEPISFTIIDSASGPCRRRLFPDLIETGSSTNTYAWRKLGDTAVISTSASLEINTATVNSYVLTIQGSCGDSSSDTFSTYTPCPCSIGAVFGSAKDSVLPATLATGLSGGEYHLSGNLDITASLSFSNVNVLIEPGSRIRVAPGAKLTLDNAHLFVCPDTNLLWKGIKLEPGANSGRIAVIGNTLIEDADTAIKADYISTPASGYIIETDDAAFNRNRCGIYLGHYNAVAAVPIHIGRTLFTTRELRTYSGYPTSWPAGNTLRARVASMTSTQPPFRIARDYGPVQLKDNGYSLSGIVLDAVGATSGTTFFGAQIGVITDTSHRNVFDRTGDGIVALNSNARVVNGAFLNMSPLPPYLRIAGVKHPYGAGVAATDGFNKRLVVSYASGINTDMRNEFFDCEKGIFSSGYSVDSIYDNYFYQSNTNAAARFRGVELELTRYDSVRVEGNRFYNYPIGIYALANASSAGYSFGTCHLKNNRIQAQWPSGYPAATSNFVAQGIQVEGSVASASGSGIGWMNIDHNLLTEVWNGIRLNNFIKQRAYVAANSVGMKDQGASYLQYGVYTANTNDAVVYGNQVTGTPATFRVNKWGYYSAANKQLTIQCNNSKYMGVGFDFYGTQPRTFWWGNNMADFTRGFALGGIIDQQGYSLQASLNEWNGTVPSGGAHTYLYSTADPALSVLFVNNAISSQLPTRNFSVTFGGPYVDMVTLVHTSYVTHYPCAGAPVFITDTSKPRLSLFAKIMLKTLDFSDRDGEQSWIAQFGLWRMLHADDSFNIKNNYQFSNFATIAAGSRMGWLTGIEDALAAGDTTAAASQLGQPVAGLGELAVDSTLTFADDHYADSIVANYVGYYSLYLHYLRFGACDSAALAALSYRCPHISGDVVYQARSLYETLYGLGIHYDEDSLCAGGSTARRAFPEAKAATGQEGDYRLFPNPNNGTFTLYCNGCDKKAVSLKVYNSTGMLVRYQVGTFVAGALNVQLPQAAPGLYLVCIDDGTSRIHYLRFVLQ